MEESFCRDSIYKVCFEFHSVLRDYLYDRDDDEPLFDYNSLTIWVKRQQIPLTRLAIHSILGDLRKLAEQYGDTILWEQSNQQTSKNVSGDIIKTAVSTEAAYQAALSVFRFLIEAKPKKSWWDRIRCR